MANNLFQISNSASKKNLNRSGYTLIELLVVMMTMIILFSLGYANFRGFQRRQQLESVVRMVKADLRLAQANALSGKKPTSGNCSDAASNVLAYSFTKTSDTPTSYEIRAICPGLVNTIKPVTITGATMSAFSEIQFNILGRGTNISGGEIVITITSGEGSRDIKVRSSGTVE